MKCSSMLIQLFIFFFQAEDGIRDLYVTGVQTCALPIYLGVKIDKATAKKSGVVVEYADKDGAAQKLECDRLVVSVGQIGRASCRERVEMSVVGGLFKENDEMVP